MTSETPSKSADAIRARLEEIQASPENSQWVNNVVECLINRIHDCLGKAQTGPEWILQELVRGTHKIYTGSFSVCDLVYSSQAIRDRIRSEFRPIGWHIRFKTNILELVMIPVPIETYKPSLWTRAMLLLGLEK